MPKEIFTRYSRQISPEELEELEKALQESPDDLDVLDWIAFAHYSNGSYARAEQLYRKCVEQAPDIPSFQYFLGNCLFQLKQHDEARLRWRSVLELDSEGEFANKAREKLEAAG